MAQSPQSYLPPAAQPWGRYIEKSITDINETARLAELNTKNNLKQLNSSVSLLARQQNTLEDQQLELAAQQDTLEAQQTTLESQQTTLAAQQTALENQQAYLATFLTYQSSYPTYSFSGTLSGNVFVRILTFTLSFTLTRTSIVQLETVAEAQIQDSRQTTYPQAMSSVRASFSISPGSTYYGNTNSNSVYLGSSGSIQLSTGFTVTPALQRTLTLNAGSYTVTGFWDASAYTAGGCGVGKAYITASVIG